MHDPPIQGEKETPIDYPLKLTKNNNLTKFPFHTHSELPINLNPTIPPAILILTLPHPLQS